MNEIKDLNEIKETIKWLTGLSSEEALKVNKVIDDKGVSYLFLNISELDVSKKVAKKLNHLVTVIKSIDGEIENIDFGGEKVEK